MTAALLHTGPAPAGRPRPVRPELSVFSATGRLRSSAVAGILPALLLGLAVSATACGGGEEGPKPQMGPAPGEAKAAAPAAPLVDPERYIVLGENPKWKPIAPLFEQYVKRDIHGITSPMLSNLVQYVDKPVVEATTSAAAVPGAEPVGPGEVAFECDVKSPLTEQPLSEFKLIILVTGIAQPKAVVVNRKGERLDVIPGDAIGLECGRVHKILQYRMLVTIPGKPKPLELSIAPPLSEIDGTEIDEKGAL